jgi:hypothetical protein
MGGRVDDEGGSGSVDLARISGRCLYRAAGTWLPAVVGWFWRPRPALRPRTMWWSRSQRRGLGEEP